MPNIVIEKASLGELDYIIYMSKKIYLEVNSSMDSEIGISIVLDFIDNIKIRFIENKSLILIAKIKYKIVGMIEIINGNHISSFYVDSNYFRIGIGRKLFEEAQTILNFENCSVHSSHYAINFYKKLGFLSVSKEIEEKNGIHFYSMLY